MPEPTFIDAPPYTEGHIWPTEPPRGPVRPDVLNLRTRLVHFDGSIESIAKFVDRIFRLLLEQQAGGLSFVSLDVVENDISACIRETCEAHGIPADADGELSVEIVGPRNAIIKVRNVNGVVGHTLVPESLRTLPRAVA